LTVTGPGGSDTETKVNYINVTAGGPLAEFSADKTSASGYTGDTDLTVQFADESTGEVTAWAWDFDNNGSVDSTAQNPSYTYSGFTGKKTVKLTVTGPDGSDSETKTDYIRIIPAANRIYVAVKTGNDSDNGSTWALAKKTIQAGINAASDDYAVLVAKGTYSIAGNYNLDFGGKKIHLKGVAAGATDDSGTIWRIDGAAAAGKRGFIFQTSEGAHSVVDNLEIYRGNAAGSDIGGDVGGGIYAYGASPTIVGCTIWVCRGTDGGGIYCENGSNLTITSCTLKANVASDGDGGGIYCIDSSPRISVCTIGVAASANTAINGGGIYCHNSNARIKDCTLDSNSVSWWGGGIACSGSNPLISGCTINDNVASDQGGGIYLASNSDARITTCQIYGNTATNYGGGIYCEYSTPTISGCTIGGDVGGNSAGDVGGGICLYSASPVITGCIITNNSAVTAGGGMECWTSSSPPITNCLIANNSTSSTNANDGNGGGIDLAGGAGYQCNPTITNCTIANNQAHNSVSGGDGGGIYVIISTPVLNNTILWGNTATGLGNQIYTWTTGATCTVTLNYSDYADNTINSNNIKGAGIVTASHSIVDDPDFLDAGLPGQWGGGDYHLDSTSPCIDVGSNSLVPSGVTTDLDGLARIYNVTVDMGAYEYHP
jgi:parallel beta-helix repeat protein